MQTTLIRLKPYDVRRGHLLKRYTYAGIRFAAGEWCCVDTAVADYLRTVHQTDRYSPLAFELGDEEPAPAPAASPPQPHHTVAPAVSVEVEDVEALVAELTLLVVEPSTSSAIEPGGMVDTANVEALVTEQKLLVVEPSTASAESAAATSVLVEPSTTAVEPVTPIAAPPAASVELAAPIVEPVLLADEMSAKSPADAVGGILPAAVTDVPALLVSATVADAPASVMCATESAPTVSTAADDAGGLATPGAAPARSWGHASQRRNGLQERVQAAQRRRDEASPDPADRRPPRGRPAPMLPPPSRRQRGPPRLLAHNRHP